MSCLSANINLQIYEGGTFDQTFQWKSGDPLTVVNLMGYTARMMVRYSLVNVESILSFTEIAGSWAADGESGIYFDDAADGKYRLYINDEDTSGLCTSHVNLSCVYDLFLYSPAGEALLKQYGTCSIIASVTR